MAGFGLWQYIGIGLALWVLYDLFRGRVYFPAKVTRAENPGTYWTGMIVYAVLAASCFLGADYFFG